jgi:O-antigen/teichoic acid export membrane protein
VPEPKKSPRFLNQIAIYGLGLALNYGIGFILLPVYSRLMPAEQYGILELLNRTVEIVSLLLLTQYAITFIRFYREKDDENYRKLVTSTCIYVVIIVAGAIAAVMAIFREPLAELIFKSQGYSAYFGLAGAKYFVSMVFVVPFVYFQAREEPGRYIAVSVSHFATVLGLNILFLSIMEDKVAAVLLAGIVGPGAFLLTVGLWVFLKSSRKLNLLIARDLIQFSWSFTFVGIYGFVMTNGDRYFLNEYCGKAQTGLYAFGYKIGMVLNTLVFSPVIRAWNAKMVDVLRREDGTRYLARLTTYAILLYTVAALAMSIYSREIIGIFMDDRYFAAYRIIPLVLFAHVFWGASLFFDTGIYITKRTYLKTWHALSAVVCLALYFWLIPNYCMYGAAWATVGTYFFFAVLSWYLNNRALPTNYEFGKMIRIVVPAIVIYLLNLELENWEMAHLSYIHLMMSATNPLVYTAIVIVAKLGLLLLYFPVAYLLRVMDDEDYKRIRELYNDLRSRLSPNTSRTPTPPPESRFD